MKICVASAESSLDVNQTRTDEAPQNGGKQSRVIRGSTHFHFMVVLVRDAAVYNFTLMGSAPPSLAMAMNIF